MKTPLNSRQGGALRFMCTRKGVEFTRPDEYLNTIPWSDVAHTLLQSVMTFKKLVAEGFAEKVGEGYAPTQAGREHIAAADKAEMWHSRGMPKLD